MPKLQSTGIHSKPLQKRVHVRDLDNHQLSESYKKRCVNGHNEFPHEQDHAAKSYKKEKEILAIMTKQRLEIRASTG